MILDSVVQSLAANENRTFTYVEQVGGPRWSEVGSGDIVEMLFDILENHFDSVQIEFEGTYLGQTGPSEIFHF